MSGLLADLDVFVEMHGAHAPFDVATSDLGGTGYGLAVRCPCGIVFERLVTLADAAADLSVLARRS